MALEVQLEETGHKGRFYIRKQEKDIAEMTYSAAGKDRIIIDHTQVDKEYRGQDLGKQMVYKAVEYARNRQIKIVPLCPFANAIFKKNEEIRDVL
ncbi:GNAT family N-acetyltransferase [Roseivirga sp. BDSF3-8]|uniref:GNAT family N-acetyltransferase n=1 Tax=Roseivirga sp. BDSF3-8 TaxID=3241598 RepID=UPI0035327A15